MTQVVGQEGGLPTPSDAPGAAGPWAGGAWRAFPTPDRRILLVSLILQFALGLFLGHSYDTRIFMAAGYMVGNGHSPYVAQNLLTVFQHSSFNAISTVGYPPPWPLVTGLLYRVTYAIVHNFLIYNLALKLPVIAANVGLAYLSGALLQNLGAPATVARKAWVFLLLNPFLLYFGAAWGQIDSIVALLALAALALLYAERRDGSAALLALAVCFKPTALPVAFVAVAFLLGGSRRQAIRYAAVFAAGVFVLYVCPFFVFGWSTSPLVQQPNTHFVMRGAMSYMTVVRLFRDPLTMLGRWWLLGLVWIPALAVGVAALRRGAGRFPDLLKGSAALVLVVFLTRTFLAEPDVVLVLPLVLILVSLGELDRKLLTAVWVVPLVFTLVNASPAQLLWVQYPETMQRLLADAGRHGEGLLQAKAALVVVWQAAGWWLVVDCYRNRPARLRKNADEVVAA